MFGEDLGSRLQKTINKRLAKVKITPEVIDDTLQDLRVALLEADVNFKVVKAFIADLKAEWAKTNNYTLPGLNAEQTLLKLTRTALIKILDQSSSFRTTANPTVIMLIGLQGSGKTTSAAKLAAYVRKADHKQPLLVAADHVRPAAIDQLVALGQSLDVPVANEPTWAPIKVAKEAIKTAKANSQNVIIIDTAGRMEIDQPLMAELKEMQQAIKPHYTLLVLDALTGQTAAAVAQTFNDQLQLTGVILTKTDADTRAGAIFSTAYLTHLPVEFIGTGEHLNQWAKFFPDRFADRILGRGDLKTLVENAEENLDQRTLQKTMNRMLTGQFDLQDLLNQLQQLKRMGKMQKILKLLPQNKQLVAAAARADEADVQLNRYTVLMNSMTVKERRKPNLIKLPSRKERILRGSGRPAKELNDLINRYEKMHKAVKQMARDIKSGKTPSFPGLK